MVAQDIIPLNLTDAEKAFILQSLDTNLNARILISLLHGTHINSSKCCRLTTPAPVGIYTGIVTVTLWSICKETFMSTTCIMQIY